MRPFLTAHGFSFFHYTRSDADGKFCYLASDTILLKSLPKFFANAPLTYSVALRSRQEDIFLEGNKVRVKGINGEVYVSAQEANCLRTLNWGLTVKQSEDYLSISARTFETYLQRIREKTGVFNKRELISLLTSGYY